jgi:3-hydroxyisobutyrate dehydrogenase
MSEMIGFIGLGNMGAPMAGRLLDGGYALTVIARVIEEAAGVTLRAAGGAA